VASDWTTGPPVVNSVDADVLVVGAGTTGLVLALQAHDHGARVRIVERREQRFRPSRALIIHPRTLEVLRPLGVTDALLARGDPAPLVRLHLGPRQIPVVLGDFSLADTAFPHLLIEAQATVEAVLSEALASRGVEVERGSELVELRREASANVARLRRTGRDELISCRYVAGCDGPTSFVRRSAGVAWRGAPCHQEVVLADVELEGDLGPGMAHAVAGRAGVLFLFALGERAPWRLLCTRTATAGDGLPGQPDGTVFPEDLQGLIDGAGLVARLTAVAWSARVPLEHRVAARYRAGPLFFVGDAAHVHSPAGGQGMNTGIQDATNLGWKLAFAAARAANGVSPSESLLDSYESERRPVARRVVELTELLFWRGGHRPGGIPSSERRDTSWCAPPTVRAAPAPASCDRRPHDLPARRPLPVQSYLLGEPPNRSSAILFGGASR
jgi:2-polyprenyl-6-methoxyphenol hydroxylase-like FAD-dependent oxidoreductase